MVKTDSCGAEKWKRKVELRYKCIIFLQMGERKNCYDSVTVCFQECDVPLSHTEGNQHVNMVLG